MNRVLLFKFWRDCRWLLLGCCSVVTLFATLRVWLVSQLDAGRFRQILELLPTDFRKLSPVDFDWAVSYTGRLSFLFEEPLVHLSLFVWCIARGSDAVSGELDRGTGEILFSHPMSRRRYLALHIATTVLGIFAISAALWFGQWLGIQLFDAKQFVYPELSLGSSMLSVPLPFMEPEEKFVPMTELVVPSVMFPAACVYAGLGLVVASVATFASSFDRLRWRTIGIASGFYVLQAILKIMGTMVESLSVLEYFTIFSLFEPEKLVAVADLAPDHVWSLWLGVDAAAAGSAAHGLGAAGALLALYSLAAFLFTLSMIIFDRRDLPAPV